ncbi:MAG: hypothetical protein H0T72_07780, partial [Chloroflexia bacterium]|nr:hypothetical protein [Chloroflexia bacterium]
GFDERVGADAFSVHNVGREMPRDTGRSSAPRGNRQPAVQPPVYPDDDWETESSIVRFLRER